MIRLGVNIDHIATLRNARGEGHPNILKAAQFVMKCGADLITIHLREDRRHIKDNDLKLIGYNKSVKNLVNHQAKLAKRAGLDALVCSPFEVAAVRKIFKNEIITPGVQIGKKNYDQKRSMEAKRVKSDWLVIGRAITRGNIKKNIQNLVKELR